MANPPPLGDLSPPRHLITETAQSASKKSFEPRAAGTVPRPPSPRKIFTSRYFRLVSAGPIVTSPLAESFILRISIAIITVILLCLFAILLAHPRPHSTSSSSPGMITTIISGTQTTYSASVISLHLRSAPTAGIHTEVGIIHPSFSINRSSETASETTTKTISKTTSETRFKMPSKTSSSRYHEDTRLTTSDATTITELPTTLIITPVTIVHTPKTYTGTSVCTTLVTSGSSLPTYAVGQCGQVLISNPDALQSEASASRAAPARTMEPMLGLVAIVALTPVVVLWLGSSEGFRLYLLGISIGLQLLWVGTRIVSMGMHRDGLEPSWTGRMVLGLVAGLAVVGAGVGVAGTCFSRALLGEMEARGEGDESLDARNRERDVVLAQDRCSARDSSIARP